MFKIYSAASIFAPTGELLNPKAHSISISYAGLTAALILFFTTLDSIEQHICDWNFVDFPYLLKCLPSKVFLNSNTISILNFRLFACPNWIPSLHDGTQ